MYYEEIDRLKQVETKTNIALAFIGVLFGAYLALTGSNLPTLDDIGYLIYSIFFKIFILVLILISLYYFYKSMKVKNFEQLDIDEIVNKETAISISNHTKLAVAATYKKAVLGNRKIIEDKNIDYDMGLKLVGWALVVFVIHYIIEVIIKHVTT